MARNLIIDTDCGIDDAQAILMALSHPEIKVLGITTVAGNTSLDNVITNVLRVLRVANRLDIPVYKGCCSNIVNIYDHEPIHYHGTDGLGDFPNHEPVNLSIVQDEHAASALLRIAKSTPGGVDLVTLGPLTNVAVSMKLDHKFASYLNHCIIMGGNYKGKGNITMTAEFNFFSDPEAAHIVLQDLQTEILLVGWEVCEKAAVPIKLLSTIYPHENKSAKQQFMEDIQTNIFNHEVKVHGSKRIFCDEIAMAVYLDKSLIKKQYDNFHMRVELSGRYSRGQAILDWTNCGTKDEQPKVTVVSEIDQEGLLLLLRDLLSDSLINKK